MAKTENEYIGMIEAASRAKIKLMIAYRLHFEKGNLSATQMIKDGAIGEPRIFRSAFCQQVTPGNSRLREENGGGPLYDIGVYCINAVRYLFRAEPEEVLAYSSTSKDRRFREVEEMSAAIMRFPGDRWLLSHAASALRIDPVTRS
jgi:glucose-fructose oxidoreductase